MVDSWGSSTNLEVLRDEEKDSTEASTTSSELKGSTKLWDAKKIDFLCWFKFQLKSKLEVLEIFHHHQHLTTT